MQKTIELQAGYTLVELLVAMVLAVSIGASVYSVYRSQSRTVTVQQNRQEGLDYARNVMDMVVREIRSAGYNPLQTNSGANCAGSPNPGTPGLITATNTLIKFTADYRGSAANSAADGDCNDPSEEITYEYQTPGPQNCASGFGDIVRTANGTSESMTDCNVTAFSFDYFIKDSATAMSKPVTGANLVTIQRMKLSITVKSKNPDSEFGGQMVATVSSNIYLSNRGL